MNIHLHCLVLDGVYRRTGGEPVFQEVRAPSHDELAGLLDRIIARPAMAIELLKRDGAGDVVLQHKSAWRDGTTHIRMSPLEFMQRLAALVPRPRLHRLSGYSRTWACLREPRRAPRLGRWPSSRRPDPCGKNGSATGLTIRPGPRLRQTVGVPRREAIRAGGVVAHGEKGSLNFLYILDQGKTVNAAKAAERRYCVGQSTLLKTNTTFTYSRIHGIHDTHGL